MKDSFDSQRTDGGLQELTMDEVNSVSGGIKHAGAAAGLMATIGALTFGSGWAVAGVGAAFATAPVAVLGMAALGAYSGYLWYNGK